MGATEEQMKMLANAGVSHVSYILIQYSFAFLFFFGRNPLFIVTFALPSSSNSLPFTRVFFFLSLD
jgi:hypothetical protein